MGGVYIFSLLCTEVPLFHAQNHARIEQFMCTRRAIEIVIFSQWQPHLSIRSVPFSFFVPSFAERGGGVVGEEGNFFFFLLRSARIGSSAKQNTYN